MIRLATLLLALALASACKPRAPCVPPHSALSVQLLASAGPRLNPCEDGQPCAAHVQIYELKSDVGLEELDFFTVFEQREKAFGDAFVKLQERELFPGTRENWRLELDPSTTHVVTVGIFREPVGDAWFQVFTVPTHHHEAACVAAERGKPIGDPCIYLAFDEYEVSGGRFPPAGFDLQAFETICAPVTTAPSSAKKKKRKPALPSIPPIPSIPAVPATPELKAPAVPSVPSVPSAPSAPAAPAAPKTPTVPRRTR